MTKQLRVTVLVTDDIEDNSTSDIAGLMASIDREAEAVINVDGYALGGRIESWNIR